MVMDARALTFAEDQFDVVLFVGALHHMDGEVVAACFKEIKCVLRSSGVVLCAEPVFTPGKWLSTFLLKHDRGMYIRDESGYESLFRGFSVVRRGYFRFCVHRFCSFVLKKDDLPTEEQS